MTTKMTEISKAIEWFSTLQKGSVASSEWDVRNEAILLWEHAITRPALQLASRRDSRGNGMELQRFFLPFLLCMYVIYIHNTPFWKKTLDLTNLQGACKKI